MSKSSLFIFIVGMILFSVVIANGQHDHRNCGTDALMKEKLKDPEFAEEYYKRRAEILVSASQRAVMPCTSPLIIPVAVHYESGAISNQCMIDAAIAQIDQINLDFKSCNANASDLCSWIDGGCDNFGGTQGADAMPVDGACMQFCLADQNLPSGEDNVGGYAITSGDYSSNSQNASNAWFGYMNIYVGAAQGNLGFAFLGAGGSTNTVSGTSILTNTFGAAGFSGCEGVGTNNTFSNGATLTHEIGHHFGLQHTFGESPDLADTPPQNNSNGGCPTVNLNNCTSSVGTDYSGNFMDYVDDDCMSNFSADQVAIMQSTAAAQNQWAINSISCYADWQSGALTYTSCVSGPCGNTNPPTASFTSNPSTVSFCPGSSASISFTDTSADNPSSWSWTFSGAGVSPTSSNAQNPTVTVSSGGTLTATLTASNTNGSSSPTSNTVTVTVLSSSDPACVAPVASFTANPTTIDICPGSTGTIGFTESSSGNPSSWSWSFSGAGVSPTSSTAQNPTVTISSAGTLTATLTATNSVGTSSPVSQTVTVNALNASDPLCQAQPCLDYDGGLYFDYLSVGDVHLLDCPIFTNPDEVWENEAYLFLGLKAGISYTFEHCTNYNAATWPSVITVGVYDPNNNNALAGSEIAYTSGCSITFTPPVDDNYIVVVSGEDNCGGPENATDNGLSTFQCNGGSLCGKPFTDSRGIDYGYTNNENKIYVICPDNPACEFVEVTFTSFDVEGDTDGNSPTDCYDILRVYNGNSTSATPIGGEYCNTPGPGSPGTVTSTDASGCLTFAFTSDPGVRAAGWEAAISCIDNGACGGCNNIETYSGTISSGTYETAVNISTSLTATVATGSNVTFQAGTDIDLNEGFCVEPNAEFLATIAPCFTGGETTPVAARGSSEDNIPLIFSQNNTKEVIVLKEGKTKVPFEGTLTDEKK